MIRYRYGIWDIDMGDDNIDIVIQDIDVTLAIPRTPSWPLRCVAPLSRGFHSSASHLNLSHFWSLRPPKLPNVFLMKCSRQAQK